MGQTYSLRSYLWTKCCFKKQNRQIQRGIEQREFMLHISTFKRDFTSSSLKVISQSIIVSSTLPRKYKHSKLTANYFWALWGKTEWKLKLGEKGTLTVYKYYWNKGILNGDKIH